MPDSGHKLVADSMDGDDVARISWSLLDLVSQFRDMQVHCSRQWEAAITPHGIKQLVARNNFASMLNEILQDVELSRRNFDRCASAADFELLEVHFDLTEMEGI